MIVDPTHHGTDQHDVQPSFASVFDGLQFLLEERLATGLLVDSIDHAIELQIDAIQPRLLGTIGEVRVCEGNAVARHLNPRYPQVLSELAGLDEVRVNSRFAAGELDDVARRRP